MTRWISGLSKLFADARYARKVPSTTDPTVSSDAAAGFRPGDVIVNTATGNIWTCWDATVGAAKWRHEPRVLGASGAAVTRTGDTNKTAMATIVVPAGAMGVNGILRTTIHISALTNNANAKTLTVDLGATAFNAPSFPSVVSARIQSQISNKNSQSAQSGMTSANTVSWGTAGGASVTGAEDTSTAKNLIISGTLASGADNMTLDSYLVELLRPDIG